MDWGRESSYFVFCECSHLWRQNQSLRLSKEIKSRRNKNLFRSRSKRSQSYSTPFRIKVQNEIKSNISILQPFHIEAAIFDATNHFVEDVAGDFTLQVLESSESPLSGRDTAQVVSGRGTFSNLYFTTTGQNYKLTIVYSGLTSEVLPWTSGPINVLERQLVLKPSGRTLPISPRENDTLSPAAGVVIYDVLDNKPANRRYLSQYTWESSVGLLFDDVYPGEIIGSTFQVAEEGSNEILFNDIIISGWGYSYILRIQVRARETSFWDLSCLIGPFNVDMLDASELPLIESNEFRRVQVVFDGDFQKVKKDERKFEIFFLNYFGRKYPKVRWRNVTVSEGSIVVDAMITGLTEELDKTSDALADDINTGKADIDYEEGVTWRASRVYVPSRKLLEDEGNKESQSSEEGGGLSVAWIVAIVINVILIVIFVIAVVYCWMRRKKQQQVSDNAPHLKHFDRHPEHELFVNKAENQKFLHGKTSFIENGVRNGAVFNVEDERRRLRSQTTRCTCYSPRCYCSIGDGQYHESRAVEENENDPPGYPSPEPVFPTPIPSPEPEPEEDFWRPESFPQEEPEDEEVYIPEPEPAELRYYVYHLHDVEGSRDLMSEIHLPTHLFLNEVRRMFEKDRDFTRAMSGRDYRFVDESLKVIPTYTESSVTLERAFPSQEIYVQYQLPPEPPPKKIKMPAYVGPLGICSGADCTRAAKIKCLDCRNTAYCSKRCMQEDVKDHRRACYKPAWRL